MKAQLISVFGPALWGTLKTVAGPKLFAAISVALLLLWGYAKWNVGKFEREEEAHKNTQQSLDVESAVRSELESTLAQLQRFNKQLKTLNTQADEKQQAIRNSKEESLGIPIPDDILLRLLDFPKAPGEFDPG